jgi:PAS domain S-box-containing protein
MAEQHQASLRDNPEEQYRLLSENVKDFAIFLLDAGGKIATWNTGAERITGYQETEAVGQPFALLFRPQDIVNREPDKELSIAVEKGRSEDERWHARKDGSQFWAMGVVTPLWDEAGKLRGYAKIMRDITARKRAEYGAGRRQPPQGRVPGDAGARAAQPAGADPERASSPAPGAGG